MITIFPIKRRFDHTVIRSVVWRREARRVLQESGTVGGFGGQPLAEGLEVRVGEAVARVDPVQQGMPAVV
ncbi:hypothetical protein GCM10010306_058230 [Streptomyces umbrinus]|nr:hypothetical protein GCM10010306_058230 [Streptomyces umbrinus]